jgi:hypothetical protein
LAKLLLKIPAKPKQKRIPGWNKIRREHLKGQPTCQVCNTKQKLAVHHIIPIWVKPDMEGEKINLITLCENPKTLFCHFTFGHLGRWKRYNMGIVNDAESFKTKIRDAEERIKK